MSMLVCLYLYLYIFQYLSVSRIEKFKQILLQNKITKYRDFLWYFERKRERVRETEKNFQRKLI